MKYWFIIFSLACLTGEIQAQTPDPQPFGNSIISRDIREYMEVLVSDSLAGREAGTEGQKKAADYIAGKFREMGLTAPVPAAGGFSYFQDIGLSSTSIVRAEIKHDRQQLSHLQELVCMGGSTGGKELKGEMLYAGTGNEEDLENLEIRDKIILIKNDFFHALENRDLLIDRGARAVVILSAEDQQAFKRQKRMLAFSLSRPRMNVGARESGFATFVISPDGIRQLLGLSEKEITRLKKGFHTPVSYLIEMDYVPIPTENVIGLIEGTDKKEEVLVITAHYDHLGKRKDKVYYGADDNASGTTALMEVAEAFAKAAKAGYHPRRSILFIALTAEEKGLLGSKYYTQHPLYPLDQTVTNLNMDMVGHLDQNHPEDPRFVTVVGSDWLSSELHEIHERANSTYVNFELDYSFNSPDHPERFYYRSDQYNFAQHGIPVIFYTSADHEDYHKPSDTIDKIKFERIEGIARLIFYTAWEIANRENRLKVDKTMPD